MAKEHREQHLTEAERKKAASEEYISGLVDLNANRKPQIDFLTMLADDCIQDAEVIVEVIGQHLAKVHPDVKLPVLYLIDSIVKNVGGEYKALFSQHIVSMFCGVFEKVDEKVREKMFALRLTWNDVFPQQKLYTLDVKVNCMDQNWPITAKVKSPAIHLNPNFLKNKAAAARDPNLTEMAKLSEMQAQLRDKQRELLELQKHKLELELVATKQRIEEEEKKIKMQTASVQMVNPPPPVSVIPPTAVNVSVAPPPIVSYMPQGPAFRPGMPGMPVPGMVGPPPRFMNAGGGGMAGKTRVAPVNPALVNSLQMRDPRLMRQMHQQMARSGVPPPGVRPDGFPPVATVAPRADVAVNSSSSKSGKSGSRTSSRENSSKSNSSSRSHSSSKSSSRSKSSSSSGSSPGKAKDKTSPSGKERSRRDSSSSSSSSKGGKHRSRSNERSKSERKEHHTSGEKSPKSSTTTTKEASPSSSSSLPEVSAAASGVVVVASSAATTVTTSATGLAPSVGMFKDMRLAPGTRSFLKRRSKSPSPPAPPSLSVMPQIQQQQQQRVADVDLRVPPTIPAPAVVVEDKKKPPKGVTSSSEKNTSENNEKKKIIDSSVADVDLRQFPTAQEQKHQQQQQPGTTNAMKAAKQPGAEDAAPMKDHGKKRSMEDQEESGTTVASKKSKSENPNHLDVLFGTQDVDLRTLGAIKAAASTAEALTPPPPPMISKVKGDSQRSFAALRAKLASVAKPKKAPAPEATEVIERKRKHNSRFSAPVITPTPPAAPAEVSALKAELLADESTSQDANDASIKIIVAQAQEQLDSEAIDREQFNSMMKQVMTLNEENKMKKAQEREKEDARKKLMKQQMKPTSPALPTIESSFATTTAADLRRAEIRPAPGVWDTAANSPWSQPGGLIMTNPWSNPPLHFGAGINMAEIMMQKQLALQAAAAAAAAKPATGKLTIKIDNVERDIRFYEDIAIAFIGENPKEIGFQAGQRRVTCDDKYSIVLSFNATNTPWTIDGITHQIRLGCPTRELYIDNKWYEGFFGQAIRVELNGVWRMIKVDGPPPQVRIGSLRTDLVVGKINAIVDAKTFLEIFLDGQEQTFDLDGQVHVLQFADFLKTVIIDGIPYPVEFGALPKSYDLGGKKRFIRFTALPAGVIPGKCFIRNMPRTLLYPNLEAPTPPSSATTAAAALAAAAAENPTLQAQAKVPAVEGGGGGEVKESVVSSEVSSASDEKSPAMGKEKKESPKPAAPTTLSIDDLLQNLLASGILAGSTQTNAAATSTSQKSSTTSKESKNSDHIEYKSKSSRDRGIRPVDLSRPETIKTRQGAIVHELFSGMQCSSCGVRFPPEETKKYSQHLDWHFRQNRRDRNSARKAHSREWYYKVTDWIQYEEIEDLEEREKNYFETQQLELDADKEDSNQHGGVESPIPSCPALPDTPNQHCDVCHDPFEQFYHEETEEWHLRPAIRVEDRTYHPTCYADYQASLNESKLSTDEGSAAADAAGAPLEDDDVNMVELEDDDEEDSVVVVKQEKPDSDLALNLIPNGEATTIVPGLEGADDDDDDVIEVAPVEPTITEILDDDEGEQRGASPTKSTSSVCSSPTKSHNNPLDESDVEIQEPNIPIHQIDDEETPTTEAGQPAFEAEGGDKAAAAAPEPLVVKIKEEPKDDGYNEDDAFMDVGTSFDPNEEMIIDEETLDERPQAQAATQNGGQDGEKNPAEAEATSTAASAEEDIEAATAKSSTVAGPEAAPQMIATIDGNVEILEAAPAVAPTTNRIRINISNSVVVANKGQSSNNSVSVSDSGRDAHTDAAAAENLQPAAVKATVSAASLKTFPRFANGHETSGLCSIM